LFLLYYLFYWLLFFLSPCILTVSTDTFTVTSEFELITAIDRASSGESVVVTIGNDVVLTNSLVIPAGKNITLVSAVSDGRTTFRLVGVTGQSTISVDGTLVLGQLVVTHEKGDSGNGVIVNPDGTLTLVGGEIVSNTANCGGGVWNDGTFILSWGYISRNYAAKQGGGVYVGYGIFKVSGGEIWGNAANSGGGIWVDVRHLDRLFVFDNVFVSKNVAFTKYSRDPVYDAVYNSNIGNSVTWSVSFTQGYNNYDIGYKTDNWFITNRYTLLVTFSIILQVSVWGTYFFLWYSKNGVKNVLIKIKQKTAKMQMVGVFIGVGGAVLFGNILQFLFGTSHRNYSQRLWLFSLTITLIGASMCIAGVIILWKYLRNTSNTTIQSTKT
jgi:hypothetical protein